jgi:hypothetical protein
MIWKGLSLSLFEDGGELSDTPRGDCHGVARPATIDKQKQFVIAIRGAK